MQITDQNNRSLMTTQDDEIKQRNPKKYLAYLTQ